MDAAPFLVVFLVALGGSVLDEARPRPLMRVLRRLSGVPQPVTTLGQAEAAALAVWERHGIAATLRGRKVRVREQLRSFRVLLLDGRPVRWLDVDGRIGAVTHPRGQRH